MVTWYLTTVFHDVWTKKCLASSNSCCRSYHLYHLHNHQHRLYTRYNTLLLYGKLVTSLKSLLDQTILWHINSDFPNIAEKPLWSTKDDTYCVHMFKQKDNLITENCVARWTEQAAMKAYQKLNYYCCCCYCYYYYYSSTTTTFRLLNQRTFLKLLQVKPEGLPNGNMTLTPEQIYLPALSTIIVDWFGATSSIVTMRLPRDLALLMCLGAQSIIKSTVPFAQSSDAFLH